MSKKILSVLLALVFVMSTFAVSAFAATPNFEDDASEYTQTWGLNTPVENPDGTYTVEVTLKANYVAGAISFKIDGEGAKLVDAAAGAAITYVADVEFNESGLVTIIPDASAADSVGADLTAGGVVATLTYELTGASAILDLANNPKTAVNPNGTLIAVRLSNGNYVNGDMICGQPVVDKDGKEVSDSVIASVPLGAAQPADLVLTADGSTAGVLIDTTHTFGGAYTGVVYGVTSKNYKEEAVITGVVEASNGGKLVITTSDGKTPATKKGNYGTGSTIEVLNSDGTSTGKVYVFVVFGDVDGNGLINTADVKIIIKASATASLLANASPERMAANCDTKVSDTLLHKVNTADAKPVVKQAQTKIDQVAQATLMKNECTKYA